MSNFVLQISSRLTGKCSKIKGVNYKALTLEYDRSFLIDLSLMSPKSTFLQKLNLFFSIEYEDLIDGLIYIIF